MLAGHGAPADMAHTQLYSSIARSVLSLRQDALNAEAAEADCSTFLSSVLQASRGHQGMTDTTSLQVCCGQGTRTKHQCADRPMLQGLVSLVLVCCCQILARC